MIRVGDITGYDDAEVLGRIPEDVPDGNDLTIDTNDEEGAQDDE